MFRKVLLGVVLIGLAPILPFCAEGQTRIRTVVVLGEENKRISLAELIPAFDPATSYQIDYLEDSPPHRSFVDRAAQVQSTLGGLCHVGRIPETWFKIPGTRFEIAQSCPAPEKRNDRIKAWRDFFDRKKGAPIPKGSKVYVIRDGRLVIPVVERELKSPANLGRKPAISLSPACAFPNPAKGESITELCSRVQIPPFAAKIEGGDVVLTRLQSAPATAYLSVTLLGREVARVRVRVEAPVAPPQTAPVQAPGAPQPAASVCNFRGVIAGSGNKITVFDTSYGVGDKITVFSSHSVPTGGVCNGIQLECRQPDPTRALVAWYRGKRSFNPSGFYTWCQVESPCPAGQSRVNYTYIDEDRDTFYVQAPPPSGKEFASVCLPNGANLPYRDPVTGNRYAMSIVNGGEEDARCDADARGQVYVDLPGYAGDGDGDGFYAHYGTPLKGCIKRPTHPSYLGYLERPGKAPMPILAQAPAGRMESSSGDTNPTSPIQQPSSSSSSSSSSSFDESSCSEALKSACGIVYERCGNMTLEQCLAKDKGEDPTNAMCAVYPKECPAFRLKRLITELEVDGEIQQQLVLLCFEGNTYYWPHDPTATYRPRGAQWGAIAWDPREKCEESSSSSSTGSSSSSEACDKDDLNTTCDILEADYSSYRNRKYTDENGQNQYEIEGGLREIINEVMTRVFSQEELAIERLKRLNDDYQKTRSALADAYKDCQDEAKDSIQIFATEVGDTMQLDCFSLRHGINKGWPHATINAPITNPLR